MSNNLKGFTDQFLFFKNFRKVFPCYSTYVSQQSKRPIKMKHFILRSFLFIFFLSSPATEAEDNISHPIGHFSSGSLDNWNNKIFSGTTDYQLVQLDGSQVLKAESHAGASGLFNQQHIDLHKTPYLNWRWRIDKRLNNLDEQSKGGDDYSARIYVVISGGWTFWKTKAINYVWSGNTAKGSIWPNAFAGKSAMMIALRSGDDKTHSWYQEKRNVLQDIQSQFGKDIRYIDAVALMTDTDNAQGEALSYYGDIYFSEK